MSTSNSTHWGEDPSTSAPAAENTYSTQLQSPLFRLPRELRDIIYEYYAEGRRSYEYNKDTNRLRYRDAAARAENLGLVVACKIAAAELKQVAFQKAKFSTRCSMYDIPEFMGLRSKVARLHCLTDLVQTQRQRMLVCVAELLQDSDFIDIEARYPNMGTFVGDILPYAVTRRRDVWAPLMRMIWKNDVANQACIDALLLALNRANNRNPEKFAQLTSGVFDQGVCPVGCAVNQENLFKEGSLNALLSWKPDSWWTPRDEDLSRIERLLCRQKDPQAPRAVHEELYHLSLSNSRCYFSAAAIAIDYLHGIPPKQWLNLRKIVLNEDRVSRLRPACHARGLIDFCKSNSALRIEHRIGLLDNLLPLVSEPGIDDPDILGRTCVDVIVPWIENTLSLASYGMPIDAYQLVIDGSTQETVHAFEILKRAAAMQEAMLAQAQRSGVQPTSWLHDPQKHCTFPLPWHLPVGLPNAVRDIMAGTSNIQFTGPVGELWDPDLMYMKRKDWTIADWRKEWKEEIWYDCVKTSFYVDTQTWYTQE